MHVATEVLYDVTWIKKIPKIQSQVEILDIFRCQLVHARSWLEAFPYFAETAPICHPHSDWLCFDMNAVPRIIQR